jgi:transcriptional regulator with XRE-family HTH domain
MPKEEIKEIRKKLGWSQERLARELGLSFSTVSRWERGESSPSPAARRLLNQLVRSALPKAAPERLALFAADQIDLSDITGIFSGPKDLSVHHDQYMTKNKAATALIEKLKTVLEPRKEIAAAYLYGSFAKGLAGRLSDVDVAVLLDESVSLKDSPFGYKADLLTDLMQALRTNSIDLLIANNAPPFLRFQIARYGRLIFSRSEVLRIEFQVKAIADYNDIKPLLDIQNRYLSQRVRSGAYGKR